MKRSLWILSAIMACVTVSHLAGAQKNKKKTEIKPAPSQNAVPKQENQFITVFEFIGSRVSGNTLVSIEGYFVEGFDEVGQHRLILVDSVDRVISTADADKAVARGVVCFANPKNHPTWKMTKKLIGSLVMYTGKKSAERLLTEIPPKVRICGVRAGQKQLIPVTNIEYQDFDGNWKKL